MIAETTINFDAERLSLEAKGILNGNILPGGYSVPSKKLYPYQWNWDSGFVAMGFAHFDVEQAISELDNLFKGQWENGMVPHIVFHSKKREGYFPGPDYWQSSKVPHSAPEVETSGISQPPVHGFILERMLEIAKDDPRLIEFTKYLFPKVVKLHRFYYEHRDPFHEGLAYIFHPWASGRDNSPLWDDILKSMKIRPDDIPPYERYDNKIADPSERPSQSDYDCYVYLMELGKKHQYAGEGISNESPFLVQDTLFNAVLIRSNDSLIRLGERFGFDVEEIKDWNKQSRRAYDQKLWNDDLEMYCAFDMRNHKHIKLKEIGTYVSLFAEIPDRKRARYLRNNLYDVADRPEGFRVVPSFDIDHWIFNPKKYWKGPIWPQMNWLIYHGLRNYEFMGTANRVKWDFLDLVNKLGFHEYFDPRTKVANQLEHGYGGDHFSWTAAVVLDLIAD